MDICRTFAKSNLKARNSTSRIAGRQSFRFPAPDFRSRSQPARWVPKQGAAASRGLVGEEPPAVFRGTLLVGEGVNELGGSARHPLQLSFLDQVFLSLVVGFPYFAH